MNGPLSSPSTGHSRSPWNKGKIIGPRPPLRPRYVWSIRTPWRGPLVSLLMPEFLSSSRRQARQKPLAAKAGRGRSAS